MSVEAVFASLSVIPEGNLRLYLYTIRRYAPKAGCRRARRFLVVSTDGSGPRLPKRVKPSGLP